MTVEEKELIKELIDQLPEEETLEDFARALPHALQMLKEYRRAEAGGDEEELD